MTLRRPVLAFGKTWPTLLDVEAAAGSRLLSLDNNLERFAVGELVFASASDGSALQYLGPATQVESGSITVTRPLNETLAAGSIAWKPTVSCEISRGAGFSVGMELFPGVRTRVSRGGVVFSTQVSDRIDLLRMTWGAGQGVLQDFLAVRDFLFNERQMGTLSFSLVWWDHWAANLRVSKARARFPTPLDEEVDGTGRLESTVRTRRRGDFELMFYVEALSEYVLG